VSASQPGLAAAERAPSADAPRRRLFGTDGVRGVAGEQLSAELALRAPSVRACW
jgi:phosphomannomutase